MSVSGVYIASLDAKDLYLANLIDPVHGYNIKKKDGSWNLRKFVNTLDFSLELLKLREIYTAVARNRHFSFWENGKEYCPHVLNVTFKYNDKLFNKKYPGVYVRSGFDVQDDEFVDYVCIRDGMLVGIQTGKTVDLPVEKELLENCFIVQYDEDKGYTYEAKTNIPIQHNVRQLREKLYIDGFMFNGRKFVRYKRSSGSSRVGKCLFIDERFYPRIHKWELCGLKIKDGQPLDLAGWEAYAALPLSSAVGTLEIQPEEILLVNDYESVFQEEMLVTDVHDGELRSYVDTVTVKNSIWDGQSLIDINLCPDHGCYLLRNQFFKSCAFSTRIQQFFADNNITSVEQLNGQTRATSIEQIRLITTPNSIKYLKFGSFDQWLDNIEPTFAIVKYDKPTKFMDGNLTQIHYQGLNSLQFTQKEMDEFLQPTMDYIKALRHQPEVLRNHIHYPEEYESTSKLDKNDIVFRIMGLNPEFCNTRVYYNFMRDLIRAYIKNARCGHIMVHGNYSVMFGNPYEMLLHTIGKFNGDPELPVGCVHSINFDYDQVLFASRSPHICAGNIWLPRNVADEHLDKYFNLTPQILCMNSIKEATLDRNSGSDYDSDSCCITDNKFLVQIAQKNYDKFLVPRSEVSAKKTQRVYTNEDKADLDIRTSENQIGCICNLAQRLNSLLWDRVNGGQTIEDCQELYSDIAKLSVLSGIEIDKAKKEVAVDVTKEIDRLKKKYFPKNKGEKNLKPNFFGIISRTKGYYDPANNEYKFQDTSMDYLQHSFNRLRLEKMKPEEGRSLEAVLAGIPCDSKKISRYQVQMVLDALHEANLFVQRLWFMTEDELPRIAKYQIKADVENNLIERFSKLKMTSDTAVALLRESIELEDMRKEQVLYYLFAAQNELMIQLLSSTKEKLPFMVADPEGDIEYYGIRFSMI